MGQQDETMAGPRPDGRGVEEFRSIFMDTGVLSQARGSCYLEMDNTKVMAGVFGPRQGERKFGFSETGRLQCDVKLTSFAAAKMVQSKQPQAQAHLERSLGTLLEQALSPSVQLHLFPKAVVDVYAMVLESGGSDSAALVTAASVALADAGIELYDLVPACHVSRSTAGSTGGTLLLDPSAPEVAACDGGLLLAQMPTHNEVTLMSMTGSWGLGGAQEAVGLALGGCAQLKEVMKAALVEKAAAGTGAGS